MVGNPHRAQIYEFELFELILLLKFDKQIPVERFEAKVSQSTVPFPLLQTLLPFPPPLLQYSTLPPSLSDCQKLKEALTEIQSQRLFISGSAVLRGSGADREPTAGEEHVVIIIMIVLFIIGIIINVYIYIYIYNSRRWNRNPRPQPQKFSKLLFLVSFSESCIFLNRLSGALVGVGGSDFIGHEPWTAALKRTNGVNTHGVTAVSMCFFDRRYFSVLPPNVCTSVFDVLF